MKLATRKSCDWIILTVAKRFYSIISDQEKRFHASHIWHTETEKDTWQTYKLQRHTTPKKFGENNKNVHRKILVFWILLNFAKNLKHVWLQILTGFTVPNHFARGRFKKNFAFKTVKIRSLITFLSFTFSLQVLNSFIFRK